MLPSSISRSPYYFPIKRPVAVTMAVLTAVVFGVLSYRLLPINMMPEITYPSLTVRTEYSGAAPEEVENSITRPLEQALGVVRNLVEMSSSSRAEVSDILMEFDWGTDMNHATQNVREKLDVVFLPEDVKPPLILRYDPSLDPLIRIGLTSDSLTLMQLRLLTEEVVKRELDKTPGVAAVKVKGGEEEEIRVALNSLKLDQYNLTLEQVTSRLAAENINVAGGRLQEGDSEYIIRTLNEFRSVEEIGDIAITSDRIKPILLSDISRVFRTSTERRTITRVGGSESVEIEIYKESDANPIAVSDQVTRRLFGDKKKDERAKADNSGEKRHRKSSLKPLSERLTDKIRIHVLSDQAQFIRLAIQEVRSAAFWGGLLAVLVLMLFLSRLRDIIAVAVVIPVSLVCAFAAMHMAGVSLNIMSLGGLALGVGMMVDNAIVVIESIHRRRESGDTAVHAAVIGTKTVGGAVFASTLTTIVVFFPITFVTGVAGQVFGDMALTVIIALSVSLFVALFFIPMLVTVWGEKKESEETRDSWNRPSIKLKEPWLSFRAGIKSAVSLRLALRIISFVPAALYLTVRLIVNYLILLIALAVYYLLLGIHWTVGKIFRSAEGIIKPVFAGVFGFSHRLIIHATSVYIVLLKSILHRPGILAFIIIILSAISYGVLFPELGGELIPGVSQGTFNAEFTLPVGTPLERTAEIILPIERSVAELSVVKKASSRIGGELLTAEVANRGPHNAVITVMLKSGGDLEEQEESVIEAIRNLSRNIPSLTMLITHPTLFTFKQPLEVIIREDNLDRLRKFGKLVEDKLRSLSILADVESSIQPGHPEINIRFDRDRIARLGLTARGVAERIKTAVLGNVPTKYREEDRRIDIRVQYDEADRETLEKLRRMVINPGQSIPVTLSEVAELEIREGPAEIRHVGGTRAAVLTTTVRGTDLKHADSAVRDVMGKFGISEGYDYIISGQQREMKESLKSLRFALFLAIFLVYVVMASQFESLLHPFLILLTIPLAVAAVIPMLWGTGIPLSVMVFLGLIVLAGIVVNDSIVLVDYTNQLVRSGMELDEAVITAGKARFRPILMTSLTTIFALLPMALGVGEGVEIRRPMAVTVIYGLTFSTIISLVIIPVLYRFAARIVPIKIPTEIELTSDSDERS